MPDVPRLRLPHPVAGSGAEAMARLAEALAPRIVAVLRGEADADNEPLGAERGVSVLTAPDEAAALEQLHRLGCTDGLPVVVPTPERVAAMALAAVADPTTSLGVMGPLGVGDDDREGGRERGHGRVRARPHADRPRRTAGAAATRVRPVRGPEHDALDDAADRRERSAGPGLRDRRWLRRPRARPSCQRLDRAGRAPLPDEHRRRSSRRVGHGAARPPRQVHDVPGRERRRIAVGAVLGGRRLRPAGLGRHGRRRRGAALGRVRRRRRRPGFPRSGSCASSPGRSPTPAPTTPSSAAVRWPSPSTPTTPPCWPGPGSAAPTSSASCTAWRRTGAATCATSTPRSPGRGDADDELAGAALARSRPGARGRRWRPLLGGVPVVVGRRPRQPDPPRADRGRPGVRRPGRRD